MKQGIKEKTIINMYTTLKQAHAIIKSGYYDYKILREIAIENRTNITYMTYAVRNNIFERLKFGKYNCLVSTIEPYHARLVLTNIYAQNNSGRKSNYISKKKEKLKQKEVPKKPISEMEYEYLVPSQPRKPKLTILWGLFKIY